MWVPLLAALTLIQTHTWVGTGPALAGTRVVWGANAPAPAVYASSPVRRIWRAPRVLLPADVRNDPFFDVRATQRISKIAASARRTAFIRQVDLQLIPKCASQTPPCMAIPVRLKPFRWELWTGAPGRSFKHVNRSFALDADVDGGRVLYSDTSRVVLGRTLVSSRDVEYPDVALARHYAAWTEVPRGKNFFYTPRALVVYDLAARRVAYRLDAAPFIDIDLAPDGTVVFGQDPTPVGGSDGGVGWASLAEPRPHYLVGNAIPFDVRTAGGRVAYFNRARLVVQKLDGALIALQQATFGGFDFAGNRLAYLSGPKEIAVTRLR
jgi:hypothetical protein